MSSESLEKLVCAGSELSNIAFNMAQNHVVDDATRGTMDRCRRAWDDALHDFRKAEIRALESTPAQGVELPDLPGTRFWADSVALEQPGVFFPHASEIFARLKCSKSVQYDQPLFTDEQMRAYGQACASARPAKAEGDAQDAARYRWLRDRNGAQDDGVPVEIFIDEEAYSPGFLDEQVDAAMGAARTVSRGDA